MGTGSNEVKIDKIKFRLRKHCWDPHIISSYECYNESFTLLALCMFLVINFNIYFSYIHT